jgi:hypothetical protein
MKKTSALLLQQFVKSKAFEALIELNNELDLADAKRFLSIDLASPAAAKLQGASLGRASLIDALEEYRTALPSEE